MKTGERLGPCGHQPRDACSPGSQTRQEGSSPGASRRRGPCPHLDFGLLAPELGETKFLWF